MGSAITTVGNKGGKPLFAFTAPNQDSGPVLSAHPIATGGTGSATGDLPVGYKSVLFQVTGNNDAGSITVYGTIDVQTARGLAQEWVPVPAPSTEAAYQWSNPLTKSVPAQNGLYCNAPFIAYKAVSSADFNGNLELVAFASP